MKVPPIGCPSPTALANVLRLKNVTGVVGVTQVWLLNASDCSNRRKIYLSGQSELAFTCSSNVYRCGSDPARGLG